jgi:hypothetical protein
MPDAANTVSKVAANLASRVADEEPEPVGVRVEVR